jgi:hypothetical protein
MRFFWMLLLLAISYAPAQACDVCGPSASDNIFGLLPNYKARFIGFRYQFRTMQTEHPPLFEWEETRFAQDYFQTAEVWGRYGFFNGRLQLYGFLPYNIFQQEDNGTNYFAHGIGDLRVMAQWTVYETVDSAAYQWRHQLQLAGGVKLPTGARNRKSNNISLAANMQPGTGSFDFPLNLNYSLQYRKMGLNVESNLQINLSNPEGYRFGHRFSQNLRLFYRQELGQSLWLPSVGLNYQQMEVDRQNGQAVDFTGGQALWGTLGVDLFRPGFSIGLHAQKPIAQHLGDGFLKAKWQASLRAIVMF